MADKPSFAEILVSQLGKPKEPFGWEDVLLLSLLAAAFAAYWALEYGAGRLLARLFGRIAPRARRGRESGPEE